MADVPNPGVNTDRAGDGASYPSLDTIVSRQQGDGRICK